MIVGDAGEVDADRTYKKQLLQRVAELGLQKHVVFPGWRKDVHRMLSIADCYVHASLWEGSPLAVIEAMAASLPVIVSDCGGVLPTFRNGEHGWVVPVADIRALNAAMLEVLNLPPETRLRIGAQARKLVVSQYDSSIIGGQFVEKSLVHVFARRAPSKPGV